MQNRSFVQLALVDEGRKSVILDIAGYRPGERVKNQIGAREALPKQYGDAPEYTLVVGLEPEFASWAAIWRSGFPEALESRARNSRRRL